MGQKDSGSEMKELLKKLSSWSKERQESQRLLDNLLSSYSGRFDKGIDALTEEVGDLKAQLSVVTKERNYLHETNKKLGSEIRQQRDKFALFKNLLELENEENYNKDNQDMDSPEGNISDSEDSTGMTGLQAFSPACPRRWQGTRTHAVHPRSTQSSRPHRSSVPRHPPPQPLLTD